MIGLGGAILIGMGVLIWTGEFTVLNIHVDHWLSASACRTSTATHTALGRPARWLGHPASDLTPACMVVFIVPGGTSSPDRR